MQKFSSIFSQLLQLFSRAEFQSAVNKHKTDYASKGLLPGTRKRRKTSVRLLILGNIFGLYPSGVIKRT